MNHIERKRKENRDKRDHQRAIMAEAQRLKEKNPGWRDETCLNKAKAKVEKETVKEDPWKKIKRQRAIIAVATELQRQHPDKDPKECIAEATAQVDAEAKEESSTTNN